ncbi:sigma 54-interacting transcriptional regulator [Neorhizobium sp. IRS_2294]|uniref:sigma 54-interacting transcriptional regulator n=1 Tax=unclassified Neorhizobium TaxID=2629175 RepID=UPI003D27322E
MSGIIANSTVEIDLGILRISVAAYLDLKQSVQNPEFREDLFFRLAVLLIESVPLRDLRQDIPLIAQRFMGRQSVAHRRELTLSNANLQTLQRYAWPGNVRDLQNVNERPPFWRDSAAWI